MTPSSGSATTYAWDEANRLTQATTGPQNVSFAYDGNGLRQSETNGSTTTHFTWDVEGSLPLLLSDGTNSYIYGPSGAPVEQISSSGTPTYLLADQLGSTRALTGSSGSVTATFSYDPWGNLAGSTGSATTPFMYAGQYYDSATGLYYMQARYYDPATGQFMSLDPDVAATNSPFDYAGDDPVNEGDPSGLAPAPGCGPGANVRKVVQTYSAKRFGRGGYMTATLYCGNDAYGYRHLEGHVSEFSYAGSSAWTLFSNAIAATLRTPQTLQYQEANDTYLYTAPWVNVNYGEDVQINYLFFTIINPAGTIITAYARQRSTSAIPGIPIFNVLSLASPPSAQCGVGVT